MKIELKEEGKQLLSLSSHLFDDHSLKLIWLRISVYSIPLQTNRSQQL